MPNSHKRIPARIPPQSSLPLLGLLAPSSSPSLPQLHTQGSKFGGGVFININMNNPIGSGGAGKAAQQRQHRPPAVTAVSNPYLKKATNKPMTNQSHGAPSTNHHQQTKKAAITPAISRKPVGITPKDIRNTTATVNRYTTQKVPHSKMISVTPTPKKPIISHAPSSSHKHIPQTKNKVAAVSSNPQIKQQQQPIKRTRIPTTKQSLKQQIAHLKHQKKLHLLQRQQEKQRIAHEKELKRIQLLQEKQRHMKQLQERKDIVKDCVDKLVLGVEQRIKLEEKSGVHYSIGECMNGIINTIEEKDKKEKIKKVKIVNEKETMEAMRKQDEVVVDVMQRMRRNDILIINRLKQQGGHLPPYYGEYNAPPSASPQQAQEMKVQQQEKYLANTLPVTEHYALVHGSIVRLQHEENMIAYHRGLPPVHRVLGQLPLPFTHQPTPQGQVLQSQVVKQPLPPAAPTARQYQVPFHPTPVTHPCSPYNKTHYMYPHDVHMTKQKASDSFGVTLRWESRFGLVPTGTTYQRVEFAVLSVVNTNKATPSTKAVLHPDDIILSINGRPIGNILFKTACQIIGSTSLVCPNTGVVTCVLKVARKVQVASGPVSYNNVNVPQVMFASGSIPVATPMIPFHCVDNKVLSGEFSPLEWSALVRGLSTVPQELFSGMAILPTSAKDVLTAILKHEEYGKLLKLRSIETLEKKLAYESNQINQYMNGKAFQTETSKWLLEVSQDVTNKHNTQFGKPLTDAERTRLRQAARPSKGCKCGSSSHMYINDPQCVLYRDVRQYCADNSIDISNVGKTKGISAANAKIILQKKKNAKTLSEKQVIDRFIKAQATKAAEAAEAEFVLEMEKIQIEQMKKAVFAPPSLTTVVLSAVASVMDYSTTRYEAFVLNDDEESKKSKAMVDDVLVDVFGKDLTASVGITKKEATPKQDSSDDSESDDSDDDDDVPLNQLVSNSAKRAATAMSTKSTVSSPLKKKAKQSDNEMKASPSPYFLALILKTISTTHGHVFKGKMMLSKLHIGFYLYHLSTSTSTAYRPYRTVTRGLCLESATPFYIIYSSFKVCHVQRQSKNTRYALL